MNASFESSATRPAPSAVSWWQSYAWSVRRELWEHPSVIVAPLAAAAITLAGFLIGLLFRPRWAMPTVMQHGEGTPYEYAALLIMLTAFVLSFVYSLGALHGERRDRSILLWKSLPVSDLTTVLAKASVPLLVLPLVSFVVVVATQSVMFLLHSVVLLATGQGVGMMWQALAPGAAWTGLLYHLITVHVLWYAPLYAWLLLASAWARRAPLLWAVLPPLVVGLVERIAFGTSYFAEMLRVHFLGAPDSARMPSASMLGDMPMDPARFVAMPGLWIALALATLFLGAAVRLRRSHGPL
jgi:ABC-2 type transport system permease protein